MELAELLRPIVEPLLEGLPASWPYEDRVVVTLLPELALDAEAFHGGHGPELPVVLHDAHALPELDRTLLKELCATLERKHPGILEALQKKAVEDKKR
jgi:hypothetical protein